MKLVRKAFIRTFLVALAATFAFHTAYGKNFSLHSIQSTCAKNNNQPYISASFRSYNKYQNQFVSHKINPNITLRNERRLSLLSKIASSPTSLSKYEKQINIVNKLLNHYTQKQKKESITKNNGLNKKSKTSFFNQRYKKLYQKLFKKHYKLKEKKKNKRIKPKKQQNKSCSATSISSYISKQIVQNIVYETDLHLVSNSVLPNYSDYYPPNHPFSHKRKIYNRLLAAREHINRPPPFLFI